MKKRSKKAIITVGAIVFVLFAGVLIFQFGIHKKQDTAKNAGNRELLFSETSGVYEKPFSLELQTGSGKIFYTLDGSSPVSSDTRMEYTEKIDITDRKKDKNQISGIDPVLYDAANTRWDEEAKEYSSTVSAPENDEVDKITVVKAAVQNEDGSYSSVQTHSYFIGSMKDHVQGIEESCKAAGIDLAVMSISMDSEDLFDPTKGIYVKGDIFNQALAEYQKDKEISSWEAPELGRKLDANYKQRGKDWERPAHIDYFESNGENTTCRLQQDCGIRVQGNYSRSDLQKGFRLCAGEEYGAKNFEYAFFGEDAKNDNGEIINKYKKLVLRNGGNCAFTTKFSDTYWQSLIRDLNGETQASRACIVYLNGEYWGLYILQEDYDDNYFENTHGVDNKSVVVYKGDAETYEIGYKLDEGEIPAGEDVSYYFQELLDFYKTHKNLKSQKDYDEFGKLVDIESVRDYFAVNIWVNNKWDWPGKNWTAWKVINPDASNPYADGRWRLCFYDLDFGGVSGKSDAPTNTVLEDNYKPNGLLDMDTKNPVVLMYAYLMTNKGFRNDFISKLEELTENHFESEAAIAACTKYKEIYEPLYPQFYTRYMGKDRSESSVKNAINGGYASYSCIVDFLKERKNHIPEIIDWIKYYFEED